MNIKNNVNSPEFQSIKLRRNEAKQVNKLIKQYQSNQSPEVYQDLVEIFAPHIEKEGALRAKNAQEKKDIIQDMHLNLIEIFSNTKEKYHPVFSITSRLNETNARQSQIKKLPQKSINRLTEIETQKLSYRQALDTEETPVEIVDRLIDTTKSLREREKICLEGYRNKESFQEIGNRFWLTAPSIRSILNKSFHKIKFKHNPEYRKEYERTGIKERFNL